MRKALVILPVLVAVVLLIALNVPKKGGIVFIEENWSSVLKKAKAEHKPIFLDISASWCGPCNMMKRQTFTDKRVAEYFNTHFINASFDGEAGDGVDLAGKYRVTAYPSLYILDDEGHVLSTSVGYLTAKELTNFGKIVLHDQ